MGLVSWLAGGRALDVAAATILTMTPGFAGLLMRGRLYEPWAAPALGVIWLLTGAGMTAGTGGAFSPAAASLLIAPVLAHALARRWEPELGAAAVLAYALAAALAASGRGFAHIGPFPELIAAASLTYACGVLALDLRGEAPTQAREALVTRRLAEVSHDLRTPLTHILGFAEVLEKEIFGPIGARNVEYAGMIRLSGNHLLQLVNDVLDLSKMEAGRYEIERETFDARALVEETARLAADAAAKKSIALTVETPGAPLMVSADPVALRRILTNIVANAIKFTPDGGRVRIAAHGERDRLVLEATDTGPGIPAEERARLGRPFERGASGATAEGTGLGLALVRALAELHGGALSFDDAPGGGALVRVEAPVLIAG